jgi:hypothetical protein
VDSDAAPAGPADQSDILNSHEHFFLMMVGVHALRPISKQPIGMRRRVYLYRPLLDRLPRSKLRDAGGIRS